MIKEELKTWWSWVLCLVMIDQITKAWAVHLLPYDRIFPVSDWFSLQLSFNVGTVMAVYDDPFGLGVVGDSVYPLLYLMVGFALAWMITKIVRSALENHDHQSLHMVWLRACMALILSGVIGNGLDKFLRGSVVDFIRLESFSSIQPIFNVADVAVWIGEAFIVVFFVLAALEERKRRSLARVV